LIALLLYLIYLLIKYLLKPKPVPPAPPPPSPPKGNEYDPGTPFYISYSVPLVKSNIQASAGEQLIFGVEGGDLKTAADEDRMRPIGTAAWTTIPGTGPYEIVYEISGDADLITAGSGVKRFVDPTITSRNVYAFIQNTWAGATITMTATVKDKAGPAVPPDIGTTQDVDHIIVWTIIQRKNPCPTGLNRVAGPGSVWVPAPALYTYEGTPHLPPPGTPSYENQTVLESFTATTALGFTMADLDPTWKAANPTLNTPDKVAAYLWDAGGNGTFVFDARDQISDQHDGFGTVSPFLPAALARGVGYHLPQTYSCGASPIGTAMIDRFYNTSAGIQIRKTGP